MKLTFTKQAGGVLVPASDIEADRMQRFKTGELYEIEIKNSRNSSHHRKVFAFFGFCFEYWSAEHTDLKYMNEHAQSEEFRKNLTILAGYKDVVFTVDGEARVRAKSLSYNSMTQDEFSDFSEALISAASEQLFHNADQDTLDKLVSFF